MRLSLQTAQLQDDRNQPLLRLTPARARQPIKLTLYMRSQERSAQGSSVSDTSSNSGPRAAARPSRDLHGMKGGGHGKKGGHVALSTACAAGARTLSTNSKQQPRAAARHSKGSTKAPDKASTQTVTPSSCNPSTGQCSQAQQAVALTARGCRRRRWCRPATAGWRRCARSSSRWRRRAGGRPSSQGHASHPCGLKGRKREAGAAGTVGLVGR